MQTQAQGPARIQVPVCDTDFVVSLPVTDVSEQQLQLLGHMM